MSSAGHCHIVTAFSVPREESPQLTHSLSYSLLRYLLYDVNPPEGFNLRRDVYIRVASLLKTLLKTEEWVLVLPPWGRLYHWQSPDIHQVRIPWSEFFDLPSLNKNIPVIEYEQFIAGEVGISLGGFSDVDGWWPSPACPGTCFRAFSREGSLSSHLTRKQLKPS